MAGCSPSGRTLALIWLLELKKGSTGGDQVSVTGEFCAGQRLSAWWAACLSLAADSHCDLSDQVVNQGFGCR